MTKQSGSTQSLPSSQDQSWIAEWSVKYGLPSQETGLFTLPPLEQIIDDLLICGGSLALLVKEITTTGGKPEMLAAQIMLAVDKAPQDTKEKWAQVTTAGTRAKLVMGKDQMLEDWLRTGASKNPTVLQSVARNTMPEVFGKEREPEPGGESLQQKKLKGHIKDLEE